jgi:hypothetical protein
VKETHSSSPRRKKVSEVFRPGCVELVDVPLPLDLRRVTVETKVLDFEAGDEAFEDVEDDLELRKLSHENTEKRS